MTYSKKDTLAMLQLSYSLIKQHYIDTPALKDSSDYFLDSIALMCDYAQVMLSDTNADDNEETNSSLHLIEDLKNMGFYPEKA